VPSHVCSTVAGILDIAASQARRDRPDRTREPRSDVPSHDYAVVALDLLWEDPLAARGLRRTRQLAVEFADQNIRVNAVCPRWIATGCNDRCS
jgi:hypothetical protein